MSPKVRIESEQSAVIESVLKYAGKKVPGEVYLVRRSDGQEDLIALSQEEIVGSTPVIKDARALLAKFAELKSGQGIFSKASGEEFTDLIIGMPANSNLRQLFPELDTATINAFSRNGISMWRDLHKLLHEQRDPEKYMVERFARIGPVRAGRLMDAVKKVTSPSQS